MDPRDGLRPTLEDVACTACGAGVPADRLRILARRDDLTSAHVRAIRADLAVWRGDLRRLLGAR